MRVFGQEKEKSKPKGGTRQKKRVSDDPPLRAERIIAGADAHGMVPGDGEGPEDESAENGLA